MANMPKGGSGSVLNTGPAFDQVNAQIKSLEELINKITFRAQEGDEDHKAKVKSLEVKIDALEELIKLSDAPAKTPPVR